jgi:KDO2-lipid IV(A) lauroyltransferase
LGKGVLVATGHLGNWELSAFAHAYLSAPMNIVVRPIDNRRIDALVESRRELSGNRAISKKDAARGILRALAAGEAVGVLIDQNTTADQGAWIDFFGIPACAGSAFVKLAHHSGAPVIPGYALWSDKEGRYVLQFEPAVEITGDVAQDTQRVHARLEAAIRKHPDQWLWIHRRWKTRPPGEKAIY